MVGMELFSLVPRQETRMLHHGTNHISFFFWMGGMFRFFGFHGNFSYHFDDDLAGIAAGIKKKKADGKATGPQMLYAGFASLFQGDHLGVEFALQSHEQLLVSENLLDKENRLRGHHLPPCGPNYEALIIDDYFAVGAHPISRSNEPLLQCLALTNDVKDGVFKDFCICYL